ncbi:MAG: outer membrane lipoprotein carrier protein LolA [Blastocatellia bacterium]|nr:outer membrane lipoprotein carrier protein LolA [Blastocatellia bacterium]
MRKVLIATIMMIAGLLMLLLGTVRPANANSAPSSQLLTGILNKMEKAHQEMKSLKAELIQEKTNTQIGITDTVFGEIIYKPAEGKAKGKLRIDYSKPNQDIVTLVGENFTLYQPRINQALKSTLAKASKGKLNDYAGIGLLLNSSLRSLVSSYNIDYVRDETINGQSTTVLRLTPKSNNQSFNNIDIWVLQNGLPSQLKEVERNGDLTVITLKNLKLNSNIPDSAFNINIPSGTKIIDRI